MDNTFQKVTIYVYDLSQGMAKSFGRMLLGRDIEGIWHTGICVYGKEYYYGGGICQGRPKQTPYGFPVKEISIGATEVPEELFTQFLAEIAPKFTMDKYDLFNNNCNNFTNECCEFLTGQPLPEYITGLPKEFLSTPFGKMIKPYIDQMQNNMMQNSSPMYLPQYFEGQNNSDNQINRQPANNLAMGSTENRDIGAYAVLEANDLFTFNNLINTEKAMIVDFFSFTCPPCMQIKPVFEALAKDYKLKCPELKFVKVNTAIARDVSAKYAISSIPTFIGFYEGKNIERFSGANRQKLESLIFTLEKKINESLKKPAQDITANMNNLNMSFNIFNPNKKDPFYFGIDNFDIPIKKTTQLTENNPSLRESEGRKLFLDFCQNPKVNLKSFSIGNKSNLIKWLASVLFQVGISDATIPVIDMLRLLTNDSGFSEAFINENPEKIEELLNYIINKKNDEVISMPRGLRMIILRLLTNIAANEKSVSVFNNELQKKLEKIINITQTLKDDRASNYACLMLFYNLILILEKNPVYRESRKDIIKLMLDLFKNENEEKNLLSLVVNLTWLIYDDKKLKSQANEEIDRIKLLTLESSENSNLRLITQDLIQLVDNKL